MEPVPIFDSVVRDLGYPFGEMRRIKDLLIAFESRHIERPAAIYLSTSRWDALRTEAEFAAMTRWAPAAPPSVFDIPIIVGSF